MKRPNKASRRETERVEFKRSFDREAIETLCAFANTGGGTVRVGVDNAGRVAGVSLGRESTREWANQIKLSTSPAIVPDIEVRTVRGRTVVDISVPEFPIKPVACRGRYYKRVGNANHVMTIREAADCHLRTFSRSWDYYLDERHGLDAISVPKVQAFIDSANRHRDTPIADPPLAVLSKFELLREGRITNGCRLLFVAQPTADTTIEMGRFETETLVKDSARSQSDLFTQVEEVLAFVRKHISKRITITGQPQRLEEWEYPQDALREVVLNAVVHRDYTCASDTIVKIFNDRISVYNPGALPPGLTIQRLLSGSYVSTPRNRQIAEMFKEAGWIEKYGSGIKRVREALRASSGREPVFEELGEGFMVTVFAATPQKTPHMSTQDSRHQGVQLSSTTHVVDNVADNVVDSVVELSDRLDDQIVSLIHRNQRVSASAIAKATGVTPRTIQRRMTSLQERNVIRRIGPDKGGHWETVR